MSAARWGNRPNPPPARRNSAAKHLTRRARINAASTLWSAASPAGPDWGGAGLRQRASGSS
eukprot:10805291-Lingulodinium_polyedra.AAC.1